MIKVKIIITLLTLAVFVFSQDTTIVTFRIPTAKITRVIDAMVGLYPIPEAGGIPEFTEQQWAKEAMRRWVVRQVRRWEQKEAQDIARESIVPDDEIIE